MTKHEKIVSDCLSSMTFSLMTLLLSAKYVKPIIGSHAYLTLEEIQELLSEVIDSFDRSVNY